MRCPCGDVILADTEDWPVPLCYNCYPKHLVDALEKIRDLSFGPHKKPHATIFRIIIEVKKVIGLENAPLPKELVKAKREGHAQSGKT